MEIGNMRPCRVHTKDTVFYGFLFIRSPHCLVIANNVAEDSLVGSLEQCKVRHCDTEADFVILPREKIQKVEFAFFENSH